MHETFFAWRKDKNRQSTKRKTSVQRLLQKGLYLFWSSEMIIIENWCVFTFFSFFFKTGFIDMQNFPTGHSLYNNWWMPIYCMRSACSYALRLHTPFPTKAIMGGMLRINNTELHYFVLNRKKNRKRTLLFALNNYKYTNSTWPLCLLPIKHIYWHCF